MRKLIYSASIFLLLTANTGCFTAAKQVVYGVTGAQGKFYELSVVDPNTLINYRTYQVEPFGNRLGEHVPEEVIDAVNLEVNKELARSQLFYPTGPRLRIEGDIIHYTGKSKLKGAIQGIFGSQSCVCRVRLTDADSGRLIGEGVCWGVVKSAVRQGPKEFGDGVGRGLEKWIKRRLPDQEVERRRSEIEIPPANEIDDGGPD